MIYRLCKILTLILSINLYSQPVEWNTARSQLLTILNSVEDSILKYWDGKYYCTAYGENLALANGNRGYALIDNNTQPFLLNYIDSMLSAFQLIGYKVIKLTIPFPLFCNNFPNRNKYIDFYKKVQQKIKNYNFVLIIEAGAAFTDSVFGEKQLVNDIKNFYNTVVLNSNSYKILKLQHLQTIIDSISPDYLTLETEPYTQQANLLGLVPFNSTAFKNYLQFYQNNLVTNNVLIGAGAGTWDSLSFFNIIAENSIINYIAPHIYPPHFNYIYNKMFIISSLAQKYNKKLLITEAWCYKASIQELITNTTADKIFGRDVFDYWISVDTSFVNIITLLNNVLKIEKSCFYWPFIKFGYLTWNDNIHSNQSPAQWLTQGWQYGLQNMLNKQLSTTGKHIKQKIVCNNANNIYEKNTTLQYQITQNKIIIKLNKPEKIKIYIYNLLGEECLKLFSGTLNKGTHNFKIYGIPSGTYIIKIITETEQISNVFYFY